MSRHLQHDLDEAYHNLLFLSGMVEEMIDQAVVSLCERRRDLADEVIAKDAEIDRKEVRIEEECLKMLALHQPVAADLRKVTTMMKVNNDLERMADLACNIAERAHSLSPTPDFPIPQKINQMVQLTTGMVRQGLDAFVNLDLDLAYRVISQDDMVDGLNVQVIDEITTLMEGRPAWVTPGLHCFSAARHLERIADHATNIAEDVVYMVNGVIVRHRRDWPKPANKPAGNSESN
jgi:phosphate transport system protein